MTKIDEIVDESIRVRHYLHRHPELSDQEFETTKFVTEKLTEFGYRITTPKTLNTGVIAEIGQGSPVVALRSDIDALPIQEDTGLEYSSINNGVMHACGHDFHIASLLGAAKLLSQNDINGTLRLIFQPAEETHVGAEEVVESGATNGIDAIIGFHNKPDLKTGEIGILPGGLMAAVDQFKVTFNGIGTHAAMPELGKDPIVALSSTITALQTIVSRNIFSHSSAVVSITHIEGGNTWNVLPEQSFFEGTVRTFDEKVRAEIKERFYEVVNYQSRSFGLSATINWITGPDVVDNNVKLTKIVEDETSKFAKVVHPTPSSAGEDFAYFSQRIPSVFVFVGSDGNSDWHHSDLILNDDSLKYGIEWYYRIGLRLLNSL